MRLAITVDASESRRQVGQLAHLISVRTLSAARESAERVRTEARARVARRTGQTSEAITVADARTFRGYVVVVERSHMPRLPYWLEYGTKYMTKRPFLHAAGALEEGPHDRRIREAIESAISAVGLGG